MIRFSWKSVVVVAAAFGIGAGAYFALGASPEKVVPRPPVDPEWKPVQARVQDLALADARWSEHSPWGAVPKPAEAAPAPPPPPPMAVGIARGPRGPEAIFMVHDAGEIRVSPGGRLPDGGRLLRINGLQITWVDGKGLKQEREMFAVFKPTSAPGQSQANGSATGAAPSFTRPSVPSAQPSLTPPGQLLLPPGFTMPQSPGSQQTPSSQRQPPGSQKIK